MGEGRGEFVLIDFGNLSDLPANQLLFTFLILSGGRFFVRHENSLTYDEQVASFRNRD